MKFSNFLKRPESAGKAVFHKYPVGDIVISPVWTIFWGERIQRLHTINPNGELLSPG
jgi:hypothetical protein